MTDTSKMNPALGGDEFREIESTEPVKLRIEGEAYFETFVDKEGKSKDNLYMYVNWHGINRKVRVNNDNWKAIKEAWGEESKKWDGKELNFSTKGYKFDGKNTYGFVMEPVIPKEEEVEDKPAE